MLRVLYNAMDLLRTAKPGRTEENVLEHHFIGIDIGASNGRIVIGRLRGRELRLEVAYRFAHAIKTDERHKRWDWRTIMNSVRRGLAEAGTRVGDNPIVAIGCCAWAQDFGLLDEAGELFYSPVSYRDDRTSGMPQSFSDIIEPLALRRCVGSAIAPVTTLCQLKAMTDKEPEALARAKKLLWIADLVRYELCGEAATDWALATASQLRDVERGRWDEELLGRLGIPANILPRIVEQPSVLAHIPAERAPHPKLVGVPFVIGVGHDTSAAAASLSPLKRGDLFVSAGTWAMVGCCTDTFGISPNLEDESIAALGLAPVKWGLFHGGMGLWLLQECRRLWLEQGADVPDHGLLAQAAAESRIGSVIPANNERFFAPRNMLTEIAQACEASGQAVPHTQGEYAKVILDSLALAFRESVERLSSVSSLQFDRIHVIGGGSQNAYLCRQMSYALNMPVIAGPGEATSVGNILTQALATGVVSSEDDIEAIVDASFGLAEYLPGADS